MTEDVLRVLDEIQAELYQRAVLDRDARIASADMWQDFSTNLNQGKLLLVPFCGSVQCEKGIKEKSREEAEEAELDGGLKMGAKSLCIPLEGDRHRIGCSLKCINPSCELNSMGHRTLFGRS